MSSSYAELHFLINAVGWTLTLLVKVWCSTTGTWLRFSLSAITKSSCLLRSLIACRERMADLVKRRLFSLLSAQILFTKKWIKTKRKEGKDLDSNESVLLCWSHCIYCIQEIPFLSLILANFCSFFLWFYIMACLGIPPSCYWLYTVNIYKHIAPKTALATEPSKLLSLLASPRLISTLLSLHSKNCVVRHYVRWTSLMARRLRLQVESISFASLEDVTYSGRSLDTCRRTRLQHGSIKRLEKTSESPLLDFLKKKKSANDLPGTR